MDISKLGQAALFYASKGWNVIPLNENSKFPPKIKEWQHEATIDVDIITQWWSKWPNANVGIATGEKSGIFVLDVDGPLHGTNESKGIDGHNSLEDLLNDHGGTIPETVEAITPSGGRHIVFKYPAGVTIPNSSNSLGDGLDVKSTNGYIVAAPSVVPAGEYNWDCGLHPEDIPAVECPAWLLSAITTEKPINTDNRPHSFERRITDGPAVHMLRNCQFMQHVQLNAGKLSYGEWLAALTNIVRATDGIKAAHAISALDSTRYEFKICNEKINECLDGIQNPQNCDYIRRNLGFLGCPAGGCGIAAPCGWSLGTVPQAKSVLKQIITPTPEKVNNPETLKSLAIVQKKDPLFFHDFLLRCGGFKQAVIDQLKISKQEYHDNANTDTNINHEITDNNTAAVRLLSQTLPGMPEYNLVMPKNPTNYSTWVFDRNGVINRKTSTENVITDTIASYTPIIISERITNIDTEQEKAAVLFVTNTGYWRSVILPKSIIFDGKKIMCLADSGLTMDSDTAKLLSKWLSSLEAANYGNIPNLLGVSKFGWRNNNTEFVYPGMSSNYVLDIDEIIPKSVINGYKPAGDHNIWLKKMTEVIKNPLAEFIVSVSAVTPFMEILMQRIFCVHNWGESRDGKSATQYAAMSIWGKPDAIKTLASSSETGIERTATLCSGLPLCICELETLDEYRRAEFESKIIYMLTEGKGKQRATPRGLQPAGSWCTAVILNAESPIIKDNTKGGIITRVIEIQGGPFAGREEFASDIYDVVSQHYGYAGLIILEQLLKCDRVKLRETYKKTRAKLKTKYPNKIAAHIDAISATVVARKNLGIWVMGESEETANIRAIKMAEYVIENCLVDIADSDESERAWQWLLGWIASNNGRFSMSARSAMPILGYTESGYINIIKAELSKAMKDNGFSPDKIFRKWADVGKIPTTSMGKDSNKRTLAVRGKAINGVKPWLIKIKEEIGE